MEKRLKKIGDKVVELQKSDIELPIELWVKSTETEESLDQNNKISTEEKSNTNILLKKSSSFGGGK